MKLFLFVSFLSFLFPFLAGAFEKDVRPFLEKHCVQCHGGEKVKGEVDFSEILTMADAEDQIELWETVSFVIEDREMPPEEEPQPREEEFAIFTQWYENEFLGAAEASPAEFTPRRLSGPEYRNTMHSVFGFDLEVNIIEAEQTVTEKSLIMKLLPPDPPGESGFINDTHSARISTTIWSQYSYLADNALEELFLPLRKEQLHALVGSPVEDEFTATQVRALLHNFTSRALRRPAGNERIEKAFARLEGKDGDELVDGLKEEMKAILMSPAFLYRGFLMEKTVDSGRQPVDAYELAERLSYFLWEDMPDEELFRVASNDELKDPEVFSSQVDRMLASPKSRSLAESFGSQWLLLDQIEDDRQEPTYTHALVNQPLDFLHYLFTENRPVMELIDSKITFANSYTGAFYGSDRKQLKRYDKPRGIERVAMPNQKIELIDSAGERGGILTMPGVLAMNRGPILRGTWMLRQIMGDHLGEPPPDIPAIESVPKGKRLTFRQQFEAHRADKSCALCHDKIDPLGFALQGYDDEGGIVGKNQGRGKKKKVSQEEIDESGELPNGESFQNFKELKAILMTSQREKITKNAVEQMMRYALCRKLGRSDTPVVNELTLQIVETNGTWRDLIHGIANSVVFKEAFLP